MAGSTSDTPGMVFISYRREETAYAAGWLYDRLRDRFGPGQIFKDVDNIEPGDDFVEKISDAVGSCDVMLALIGSDWLAVTNDGGTQRLDDPQDFVRLEIEAALARKVRVIPLLISGARMPRADQLPESLAALVRRNALELSPSRFEADTARLLRVVERTIAEMQAGRQQPATERVPLEPQREPQPELEPEPEPELPEPEPQAEAQPQPEPEPEPEPTVLSGPEPFATRTPDSLEATEVRPAASSRWEVSRWVILTLLAAGVVLVVANWPGHSGWEYAWKDEASSTRSRPCRRWTRPPSRSGWSAK